MRSMLDSDDTDLSEILCIRDKDGRPALRIGLLATMFISEPWTQPVREAVADAAEDYIRQFREQLRWAQSPKNGHMYAMAEGKVPFPRDWLPKHSDGQSWFFGFHSGEQEHAAAEFQVAAFSPRDIGKDPGYFQVYLPLDWFATHPGTFPDFVLSFANRVHPLSGYAGIGVLEPTNPYSREPFQSTVRQIAERFPGLEIENPICHTIHVGKGIKGVNWLTLLGERWVQEIGGTDYLRIRLGEDFKLTPYDGGLMIQAGPKPQLGDTQANRWPKHYVTLAKVLKPIQIKKHYPFHFADPKGSARMDAETSMAWIFRFDGK